MCEFLRGKRHILPYLSLLSEILFFEYWLGCRAKLVFTLNQRAFFASSHIRLSFCPYLGSVITTTWVMTSTQTGWKGSFQKVWKSCTRIQALIKRQERLWLKKKKNLQDIYSSGFFGRLNRNMSGAQQQWGLLPPGRDGFFFCTTFFFFSVFIRNYVLFPIGKLPRYTYFLKKYCCSNSKIYCCPGLKD